MRYTTTILLILSLLIAACGDGRDSSERADFCFISTSAHHHLDPQRMSWSHDIRIVECLFEPLVRARVEDGRIEPAVAESWAISEDGLTYTFTLRDDARWSNGDPVTAHDFIYAWRRGMTPDLGADYTQLFFCIRGAEAFFTWRTEQLSRYAASAQPKTTVAAEILWNEATERFSQTVGLCANDDRTLVVNLDRPTAYFLELCAFATFMPVHPPTVEAKSSFGVDTGMIQQDTAWTKPPHIVGNGPYVLTDWRFRDRLTLNANEHYWARAAMQSLSVQELITENPQTALLKYDQGEADWLPDIPTALPLAADLINSNRKDVHAGPAAGTYFYNFNCSDKLNNGSPNPLADTQVRHALSMAIDRDTIVQRVTRLGNRQPIARSFVPVDAIPGYEPPVEAGLSFNPDQAKKLLADAGYPTGVGLEGLSILYNSEGGHGGIAQQIRHAWQTHLGVNVNLEAVDSKHFSERLKRQDYTICRASWFGDYRDPTTFLDKFLTGNGNNDCAWNNAEYDQTLQTAANALDPARRLALLRQAETIMLEEQPIAPIFHYVNLWLYDPERVKGLTLNPWRLRRLEHVKVIR